MIRKFKILLSNHFVFVVFIILFSLLVSSCGSFNSDSKYLDFGMLFKAEKPKCFSQHNPHHIAQYSVYLCKEGYTNNVVRDFGHVEKDKDLGDAFMTFINVAGPDLERFKGKSLYLKFYGYKDNDDTSIWYYYFVDEKGGSLINKSFISLHRSKRNGKCAITGIFLNLPGEKAVEMPKDLQFSK